MLWLSDRYTTSHPPRDGTANLATGTSHGYCAPNAISSGSTAAFLLARQWLRTQQRTVEKAIASGDNAMLTTVIGTVDVSLDALSPEQKYELAREQLRSRSSHKTLVYALVFLSFLALLGLIVTLVRNGDTDAPRRAGIGGAEDNRRHHSASAGFIRRAVHPRQGAVK